MFYFSDTLYSEGPARHAIFTFWHHKTRVTLHIMVTWQVTFDILVVGVVVFVPLLFTFCVPCFHDTWSTLSIFLEIHLKFQQMFCLPARSSSGHQPSSHALQVNSSWTNSLSLQVVQIQQQLTSPFLITCAQHNADSKDGERRVADVSQSV